MTAILATTLEQVLTTFAHNWPFLVLGTVVAAALKVYADQAAISRFFRRRGAASVVLATLVAVTTPFCSCGTMAVILGMMASSVPWAPIVAFMAASPITSPEETVISAGLFGWPFALTLLAASALIGLGAGAVAHALEARGWLDGQARVRPATSRDCGPACSASPRTVPVPTSAAVACCATPAPAAVAASSCGTCGATVAAVPAPPAFIAGLAGRLRALKLDRLRDELLRSGAKLLAMFMGFAFVGYFINNLIPATWVATLFGRGSRLGVPLAAVVGLPLYLNSDASLPMVRAFVDNGAGAGAALAFIVTGAGTSLGAMAGALTIARWRVIAIVVAPLLVGAIVAGYGFDLLAPALGAR